MNLPLKIHATEHGGLEGHKTEGIKKLQSTITKGTRAVSEKQLP